MPLWADYRACERGDIATYLVCAVAVTPSFTDMSICASTTLARCNGTKRKNWAAELGGLAVYSFSWMRVFIVQDAGLFLQVHPPTTVNLLGLVIVFPKASRRVLPCGAPQRRYIG